MFKVNRGGCFSRHPSDFFMNRPNGLPYYVLLIIKSDSEICINGKLQTGKPGSALIIPKNTPYSYKNPCGEYIDDWLHFDCLPEDLTIQEQQMLGNCFPISNTRLLTTYIQQILWENNFAPTDSREYYVDTLFRILLKHISNDFYTDSAADYHPYRFKLQNLRLKIQEAPYQTYSVKEIAAGFGISASYFQALYKQFFQVSFHADIINMRVDYSKELIIGTTLPLEQIAYSCGYSNEVHFYRQFLSKTGMTPGEYRKVYAAL